MSFWDSPGRNLQQFLLPAAVLGFRISAATMRMTRSTVLEVLREDYVCTAWAKGLGGRIVVYKHALTNALIPVVTVAGGKLGVLIAAAVVVGDHPCRAGDGAPDRGDHPLSELSGGADERDAWWRTSRRARRPPRIRSRRSCVA